MNPATTCVVTGSRADYGLLRPLLREFATDPAFDVYLAVTGQHLSAQFGLTVREVEADQWPIGVRVPLPLDDDSEAGVSRATAAALVGFADALSERRPDIVVLLGDRFEVFGAAIAAYLTRLPIVHLYGGDLTLGALDDGLRHAITKLASLHCTATDDSATRVIAMGEDPSRVHVVGALGVDDAMHEPLLGRQDLERALGFSLGDRAALVAFHPATGEGKVTIDDARELAAALTRLEGHQVLVTGSNSDANGRAVGGVLAHWASEHPASRRYVDSLGTALYLSAARAVDVVVGNSSSALIEVPSLGTPSVDIGDRQTGRLRPPSVVHCEPTEAAILEAIALVTSPDFRERLGRPNPYGDGHAATRIARAIKAWLSAGSTSTGPPHDGAAPARRGLGG